MSIMSTKTVTLPAPQKLLLTVDEAADVLSLGRTYVYHLVMCNKITSVKLGRKRRIPISALQDFISQQIALHKTEG
jgi:excisionase family DNA binding protein